MSDARIFLTPDEAAGLLAEGEFVHSYRQAGFALIGADWERSEVIAALSKAESIEIGGPSCQEMKHPIVMIDAHGPCFFEADMAKTAEMETAKTCRTCSGSGQISAMVRFGDGDVDCVVEPCPECAAREVKP